MQLFIRNAFNRDDVAAGHEHKRHETTVDRAIGALSARIKIDNRDRARAAIAFRATFLRTGQSVCAQPVEQCCVRRNRVEPNRFAVQPKLDRVHDLRRPCRIFRNERERNSSSVSPVASASSSVIAPQAIPRKKKFRRPCPVAASSNTSPNKDASAAFSTKVFKRADAASKPSRKN